MTGTVEARPGPSMAPQGYGTRHRRPDRRRRNLEKFLAALVLFVALAVTVVLLGLQWLGNPASASPLPAGSQSTPSLTSPEVQVL